MKKLTIKIDSIDAVKNFVHIVNKFPYPVDLSSGRYVVDGKSIMGIFSLDLMRDVNCLIGSDDCEDLVEALSPFISNI